MARSSSTDGFVLGHTEARVMEEVYIKRGIIQPRLLAVEIKLSRQSAYLILQSLQDRKYIEKNELNAWFVTPEGWRVYTQLIEEYRSTATQLEESARVYNDLVQAAWDAEEAALGSVTDVVEMAAQRAPQAMGWHLVGYDRETAHVKARHIVPAERAEAVRALVTRPGESGDQPVQADRVATVASMLGVKVDAVGLEWQFGRYVLRPEDG